LQISAFRGINSNIPMSGSESRVCQSCKKDFLLEADDFAFFEKMKVPPPTFCFYCGFEKHLMFRNERNLYRRKSDHDGKEIISMYAPDHPYKVYEHEYWWSDKWDALVYGKNYDFNRTFFQQIDELFRSVPWPAFLNLNAVNSPYSNFSTDNKDCYLTFGSDFNENLSYSKYTFHSKDAADMFWCDKCELSYECVDCDNAFRLAYSTQSDACTDSKFLHNCSGCTFCIGCVNLKNKSYCILNEQYSKEDFEKKVKELRLHTREGLETFRKQFEELKLKLPNKYARILRSSNCTGNNIFNSKNCVRVFDAHENSEDCKCVALGGWGMKDARYSDNVGYASELVYNSMGVFANSRNIICSAFVPTCTNTAYSANCRSCSDIFGCVGLRNKQYCILNKQYTKEEYEALVPKIIEHMNSMPHTDTLGRVYKYGEYFPPEFCPFAYNETAAHEYSPLTEEQAKARGYRWRQPDQRNYGTLTKPSDLPAEIPASDDTLLSMTVECAHGGTCNDQCTAAFRFISPELRLYRNLGVPLPTLCPNCRHYERLRSRQPYKLWERKCDCAGKASQNGVYQNELTHFHGDQPCPNGFQSPFAPNRPEIVYCEQCNNSEVS
jgi:hypothetical protein